MEKPVVCKIMSDGYGSIPINSNFRGINIHLPAILMFTRVQGFDPSPLNNPQYTGYYMQYKLYELRENQSTGVLTNSVKLIEIGMLSNAKP